MGSAVKRQKTIQKAKADEQVILQEPEDPIQQLILASKNFLVNGREYTYDEKDQIFSRQEANGNRYQKSNCFSCDQSFALLGGTKAMVYCQFCAHANCNQCVVKSRHFKAPWSDEELTDEERFTMLPRGRCCKICDRKFLVRENFESQFLLMTDQDDNQKQLQTTFDQMKEEN